MAFGGNMFRSMMMRTVLAVLVVPMAGAMAQVSDREPASGDRIVLGPRLRATLADHWMFHRGTLNEDQAVATVAPSGGWQDVSVPHTWNAFDGQDGGDDYYRGDGWYRRNVTVPQAMAGKSLFLRFEGVDRYADVYINGRKVASHVGGNSAFCVDATDILHVGDKLLAVRASNADDNRMSPPISADYTFFGGIYRPVELIATSPLHLSMTDDASPGVYISTPQVNDALAKVRVRTLVANQGKGARDAIVSVRIMDDKNNVIALENTHVTIDSGRTQEVPVDLGVANPHLWNGRPDPFLYTVRVAVMDNTDPIQLAVTDAVTQPLGIRTFTIDPQRGFTLNGKPYDLHGVNRHQDRRDKGWAISSEDELQDMSLIKEMGCTAVRLAHYQQSDFFYSLCDKEGIVVWAETPNVNYLGASPAYTENARQNYQELIRQNFNHPSICFWSAGNEVRKPKRTDPFATPEDPDPAEWFKMMSDLAHKEDPGRLSAVACRRDTPYRDSCDVYGLNIYYGWYESSIDKLDDYLKSLPPGWALTEYGAGASVYFHTERPLLRDHSEEGQALLHEQTWAILKKHPEIWGKFIWNMFDFAVDDRFEGDRAGLNDKGLVTHDRTVKKDAFYFYKANWSSEPTLYLTDKRFPVRGVDHIAIKAYSNAPRVSLSVNGASLGDKENNNATFVWENVALKEGPNEVRIIAQLPDGRMLTDSTTFTFTPGAPTEIYIAQDQTMGDVYKKGPPRHNYPKKPAATRPNAATNPSIMQ
jgi:beta-galactosidase